MIEKKTFSGYVFDIANVIMLTILTLVTLYPFLYVVFASFSDPVELMKNSGLILGPQGFSLEGYRKVLEDTEIYTGYRNTIFIVVCGTFYNIVMTSIGAYVLTKTEFYWHKWITRMVVFAMFFSGGMIPTFLLVRNLGLYNSLWALILPGAISTWNMMIMRTSFMGIPQSLSESARIDGAGEFKILFKIVIPLSLPTIAVMILFYGVGHWNSWFNAVIYIQDRELYPLQLLLREILITNSNLDMMIGTGMEEAQGLSETIKHATTIVATVPILLAYPFLQKYFVKGVMIGAVKG